MVNCELIEKCLFFKDQLVDMPDMAEIQKNKYCKGDNSICARYKVFQTLGREKVPQNLFPIDMKKADLIISNG